MTTPNGVVSNAIFENVDYDLLTIGNHELYVTDVAYETFSQFSKFYGDRYLTSNVEILNNETMEWEYIGKQYRYFTTELGIRIMAFGVLFNFGGNSNVSRITRAADMVRQSWFLDAVNTTEPVDLFLVIGHNPVRPSVPSSTIGIVRSAIRNMRPDVPIQVFGGHTHIRDFFVFDQASTGLASGRYCETLGWLSMSGINSSSYTGTMNPRDVPNPGRKAIPVNSTASANATNSTTAMVPSNLLYSRRYLDWNRLTFAYHAVGSQDSTFDYNSGLQVSANITRSREELNLTRLFGCAPQTYCMTCRPFLANGSIYGLIETALVATIINESRADIPRLIIINTGSIRFDLVQGPFTYDDSFIVSPFTNSWQFLPNVPYSQASQVIDILNAGPYQKRKRDEGLLTRSELGFTETFDGADDCVDTPSSTAEAESRIHSRSDSKHRSMTRDIKRRQSPALSPGYVTTDDFGADGDDTPHSRIPFYRLPNDLQANASFPTDGSEPETVDLIFLSFIGASYVLPALETVGGTYTADDIENYLPITFTSRDYLPAYARLAWSQGPTCVTGQGVQ